MNSQEQTLSQLVSNAYGRLSGTPSTQHPSPDPVAEAYAGVPSSPALRRFDQLEAARGHTADSFAGVAPRNILPLFNPGTMPVRGMFSALAPSALGNGQFALLQDLRFDDGTLMARLPTTNRNATGLPGLANSCRGLWAGKLNGTTYVVGGWYDGSKIGIYFSTDGTAFTAATQTTNAAYWGASTETGYAQKDNRLHDYGVPLSFAVMTNKADGLDYLVIQDGTSAPRVFSPNQLNGSYVRVIKQYSAPTWASATMVQGFFRLGNLVTGCSAAAVGTNTSVSVAGSGFIETTFSSGAGAGDGVLITLSAAANFSTGQQLVFSSDQASSYPWNQVKVQISPDNVNWYTVSDPTASPWYAPTLSNWSDPLMDNTTAVGGGLNGEVLAGYSLTQMPVSQYSSVKYVKILWEGASFTSSLTWTIHLVTGGSPLAAFQNTYAVCYSGCGGLSESPGVVYSTPAPKSGTQIAFAGGNVNVPYTAGFYYDDLISLQPPSLADLTNGCDTANVYVAGYEGNSQVGDFFYLFNDQSSIGEWLTGGGYGTGQWVYNTGSTAPPSAAITVPYLAGTSVADISRYLPDGYAQCMPTGTCMASADGRGFVGGPGFYALSEYAQPFRYRQALLFQNGQPVPRSASTVQIPGQGVKAFATPSGSALASSTVYLFTETKSYAVGGFDGFSLSRPSTLAEVGVSAAGSVTQYKDAIFFLDDNQEQRRFGYGRSFLYGYTMANSYDLMPAISRRVVDDRTKAIPTIRLPWAHCTASYDRVYLAYTPGGGSANTRILVFDELVGGYVEDALSVGCDGLCYADLSAGRTLLVAGADGNLYTHEDATATTAHPVRITSGETHDHMWANRFYGRVGMVADVQPGQTATVTKTLKPNLADTSTIDLSKSASGQIWRWDSRPASTQPGLSGVSCQVDIQMTMTPGTRVYGLVLETASALSGADQT